MGLVILERAGIDDAAILEGEAGLALEEGDVLDEAEIELVLGAFEHAAVEQAVDVRSLHRAVADAALGPLDLDQRLEPIHAAGAGADDVDVEVLGLDRLEQRPRHLVGANAKGACVPRYEHARHACASFNRASSRSSSSMPWG